MIEYHRPLIKEFTFISRHSWQTAFHTETHLTLACCQNTSEKSMHVYCKLNDKYIFAYYLGYYPPKSKDDLICF